MVEALEKSGWIAIVIEFHAVAACDRRAALDQVEIAAAATLDIEAWLGFSCSSQCYRHNCSVNYYSGPGTFRFAVKTVPAGEQLFSPAFTLPREPYDY